jgi:hypothetical protein
MVKPTFTTDLPETAWTKSTLRRTAPAWTYAIRVPWSIGNIVLYWNAGKYVWNEGLVKLFPQLPTLTVLQTAFIIFAFMVLRKGLSVRRSSNLDRSWLDDHMFRSIMQGLIWLMAWIYISWLI